MKASYTVHGDPEIDETIERHMDIVVNEVRQVVTDIDSIILAGGFGRGEGTVRRSPSGEYVPMNDYDLYIFSDTIVPYDVHQNLSKRLRDKTGIDVETKFIRTDRLSFLIPDMFTFDLKSASRVIWGKDLRDQIPLKKKDVPLSAGLNTLFIETLALIESFEPNYLIQGIPRDRIPRLGYICSKVFVEICNALSLLGGFYESYCSKRADLFCKYYDSSFPGLSGVLPDLPAKVKYHTDKKLRSVDFDVRDITQRWLDARNALKYSLKYFASTVLQQTFNPSEDFTRFLSTNRRRIASFYFEPYLRYAFGRARIRTVPLLTKAATPVVRIYENFRYMRNCYNSFGKVCLTPLLRLESPLICIYLSSAFLLYSIDEGGNVDKISLRTALHLINSFYPCGSAEGKVRNSWSIMRDSCVRSFKTYASTPETITF